LADTRTFWVFLAVTHAALRQWATARELAAVAKRLLDPAT
jgi:hypothetical protein